MGKNHSPYVTGHDKYAMFIKWGDGNNAAIVVGQNPAVCQTIGNCRFHPDNTNWNIIKILRKMGYDGCIMVNTFSCIDTKGEKIKKIPEQGESFEYEMLTVTIEEVGEKRVEKIRVKVATPEPEEE